MKFTVDIKEKWAQRIKTFEITGNLSKSVCPEPRSSSREGTEYKAVDDLAASPRRSSEELAPERGEADAAGRELRGQRGEMRTRGAAPRCSPCHPQRVLLLRGELKFTRTLKSTDLNDPMRNEADLPALVNNTVTQSTALRGLR